MAHDPRIGETIAAGDGPDLAKTRIVKSGGARKSSAKPASRKTKHRIDQVIGPGSILNDIFKVETPIATGGMGQVFAGCNMTSGERVAIKVILPHLSKNPQIILMFRREADALTKLSHPALVKYRLLAKDKDRGVFYIVTEFIDGAPLWAQISGEKPPVEKVLELACRLAGGLDHAHSLDIVHRDISPDNILVPGGDVSQAKIIDFGIVKDLDPLMATLVGDGFSGKIAFSAPEQFGEFGGKIGPQADIYSLGLVLLSYARGKAVDMGSTLVEAVDKRRVGVDTSDADQRLRPLLSRMLEADPGKRLESAADVIEAVQKLRNPIPRPPVRKLFVAAALCGVAAVGAYALLHPHESQRQAAQLRQPTTAQDPAQVRAALSGVACSWLTPAIDQVAGATIVHLTGVAGAPATAEAASTGALADVIGSAGRVGPISIQSINPTFCPAIDGLKRLASAAPASSLMLGAAAQPSIIQTYPDGRYAEVSFDVAAGAGKSFALVDLSPSGKITLANINGGKSGPWNYAVIFEGQGRYRVVLRASQSGHGALVLLTGPGSFDNALLPPKGRDGWGGWGEALVRAKARGWQAALQGYEIIGDTGKPIPTDREGSDTGSTPPASSSPTASLKELL